MQRSAEVVGAHPSVEQAGSGFEDVLDRAAEIAGPEGVGFFDRLTGRNHHSSHFISPLAGAAAFAGSTAAAFAPPGDPAGLASIWETPGTRAGTAAVPVMVCFGVAVDVPHFTVR